MTEIDKLILIYISKLRPNLASGCVSLYLQTSEMEFPAGETGLYIIETPATTAPKHGTTKYQTVWIA